MSFFDLLRGVGIVFFIVVLAGVIAYLGDRVGHQVGRKRLTLFNIRPKYTSTIVAVGTGMLIALIVTLGAIFASNQVKTAFFRLGAINAEIQQARQTAAALEAKTTTGQVVVNYQTLMSNSIGKIPQNASSQVRRQVYSQYYRQTVANVNRTYTRYGLQPFKEPKNVQQLLNSYADDPRLQSWLADTDVLLLATADQNQYRNDPIHFAITAIPDRLVYRRGDVIAQEIISSGKNVNVQLAISELANQFVPYAATKAPNNFPPYFARNTGVVPGVQRPEDMQRMLSGGQGGFVITAFAATDIYPHTFGIPIVVTLQKASQ